MPCPALAAAPPHGPAVSAVYDFFNAVTAAINAELPVHLGRFREADGEWDDARWAFGQILMDSGDRGEQRAAALALLLFELFRDAIGPDAVASALPPGVVPSED